MKQLRNMTPMKEDFGKWYTDVIIQGQMIEYGLTKGSIIYKPNAYGIWENIQKELNIIFSSMNVQNVYLPLLIPKSSIEIEKNHIEGFSPELATITKAGDKTLKEEYVLRPTSETLFGNLFSKEIRTYVNLPIFYNQWANVFRWEKSTNPFLRTREFLWQEGHTCHATAKEALLFANKMIHVYSDFLKKYLAIPTIIGKKTEKEKFAGAVDTFTIEAMMKDGKALQVGTSHYLGQNFSKPFDIKFHSKDKKNEFVYQTSWGVSTRLIGAIIMSHGDDRGLVVPPLIAKTQVDIIEIFASKNPNVSKMSSKIFTELKKQNIRSKIDNTNKSPGFKASQSEITGTPIRIEVGPRDLENDQVIIVRRDTLEKKTVNIKDISKFIKNLIPQIQENLFLVAQKRLNANIIEANSYEDMKEKIKKNKFVIVPFAGNANDEKKIQEEIFATTRCIIENNNMEKKCIITNIKTKQKVIFAKAY